jgi:hypothetical protein
MCCFVTCVLQERMDKRPRAAGPEVFTNMADEDHTMSATPDSNLNVSSLQVKKKKRSKKPLLGGQDLHADFEAYLYRNLDRMAVEHSDWSDETVEEYLLQEWNEMDPLLKPK